MTNAEVTIAEILAAIAYYAFLFAGSITIGYLFLRLTHPEVRTLPKKQKTRNAFLAGAGFLTIAIAIDAASNGFNNVLRVNSFTPLIASLLAGFTFIIFNLATSLKTRPLIVGIHLPKGRPRVARGLAYVEEVIIKPPPLVERELVEEKPAATAATAARPAAREAEKSVHEKLEELKRAGAIRVEKPVIEKPAVEKPKLEKPLTAPTPVEAVTTPATAAATPVGGPAGAPAAAAPTKKGFFARLFGGGKPKAKPTAQSMPIPSVTPVKKEETEIEVIVKELGLVQEKPAARGAPGERPTAPPGGERHRLYMRVKETAEEQKSRRVSEVQKEREEVGEFVKDVYAQLKAEQKPEGLREKVGVRQPKKEFRERAAERGKEAKVEEKPLSLADLLGVEKPGETTAGAAGGAAAAPAPASGLFAELEALAGGGAKREEAKPEKKEEKFEERKEEKEKAGERKEGEMAFVKMQAPDVGCPTCHSKNTKIIFCPYCGTGLCANCASSLKTTLDAFVYTCPKCGEEITVKRKAAAIAGA